MITALDINEFTYYDVSKFELYCEFNKYNIDVYGKNEYDEPAIYHLEFDTVPTITLHGEN